MGTDIHLYVERRRSSAELVWERAEPMIPNPNFEYSSEDDPQPEFAREMWYTDRNYRVFSLLAGVRGRFSGIDPIISPRGLPPDLSDEVRNEWGRHSSDWHTPTYYYDLELTTFPWWERVVEHSGWADDYWRSDWDSSRKSGQIEEIRREIRVWGAPHTDRSVLSDYDMMSILRSISRPVILNLDGRMLQWNSDTQEIVPAEDAGAKPQYERVHWKETYAKYVGDTWLAFVARLAGCCLRERSHQYRVVLWFDN